MSEVGEHIMYRLYAQDGALLYLGITVDLRTRLDTHRREKPWWPEVAEVKVQFYPTRQALEVGEAPAIAAELPRYNVIHAAHNKRPSRVLVPTINIPARIDAYLVAEIKTMALRDGLSEAEETRRLIKWATEGPDPMPPGWH